MSHVNGQRVAFLDCETTGLDPDIHPVWEVGLIVGGEEYHWFVDIGEFARLDPAAEAINGFDDRYDPEAATPAWSVASQMHALLDGHVIVGANPMFDLVRIGRWWQELGWQVPWHYRPICIESVLYGLNLGVARALERSNWETTNVRSVDVDVPWRASELYERVTGLTCPEEDLHTALGDARFVQRLWEWIHD